MTNDFLYQTESGIKVNFRFFDSLESTNKTAKELALSGADEGTVIVANAQTGGRGRLGRSFYSPAGTGLYFSIILRPDFAPNQNLLITPAAAVAVSRAIESVAGINTNIKWVNDIFANGKKVCGILSESVLDSSGKTQYIILGIGINLTPPKGGFPADIKNIAGTVLPAPDKEKETEILKQTVNNFFKYYSDLSNPKIFTEYDIRLMLKGQKVGYTQNGILNEGTVLGVSPDFNLIIKKENEDIIHLSSGEVTIGSKTAIK